MPPLSSISTSQLSYETPLMMQSAYNKPLHLLDNSETSFLSAQASMEVKPRYDLWGSDNANIWSLPAPRKSLKKGVRFGTNEVHEIIHINDYSPEEIQACWVTRSERHESIANRNACVARLDAWMDLPEDEAMEGLERTVETRQSMQHIAQAIHAVLAEQYDQRIFGMQADPEYIALRYSTVVDSFPRRNQSKLDMPNPVGIVQTEQSVRYHEVAPMA